MRESIVRVSFDTYGYDCVLSISEVNFLWGVVRVRCRREKFTLAI